LCASSQNRTATSTINTAGYHEKVIPSGGGGAVLVATQHRLLRALAPLLCLLAVSLSGCEYKAVTVQLPSFFSAGVDELWFWRLEGSRDEYVRSGHIRFAGLIGPPGRKVVQYTMVSPKGEEGLTLTAPVKVRGDSIVVELNYARFASPGWFRVSSRNRAGESPLSEAEIFL
jgi:hypothetical protein